MSLMLNSLAMPTIGRRALAPGIASLAVMAVCGPLAPCALAAPVWNVNGSTLGEGNRPVPVIYIGTLRPSSAQWGGEPPVCEGVTMVGTIWNEKGHGVGKIEGFAGGRCNSWAREGTITAELEPGIEETAPWADVAGKERQVFLPGHRDTSLPWRTELVSEYSEELGAEATYERIGTGPEGQSCQTLPFQVPRGCIRFTLMEGAERHWTGPTSLIENWYPWHGGIKAELANGVKNGLWPSRLTFSNQPFGAEQANGSEDNLSMEGGFTLAGRYLELIRAVSQ
jgi:hypothetical protein